MVPHAVSLAISTPEASTRQIGALGRSVIAQQRISLIEILLAKRPLRIA